MSGRTEARIMSDLDGAVDCSADRAADSVPGETPDTRFPGGIARYRRGYRLPYRKGGS